jgi:hypothetical protein
MSKPPILRKTQAKARLLRPSPAGHSELLIVAKARNVYFVLV